MRHKKNKGNSISAKQLLENFMNSSYNEEWDKISSLTDDERFEKRLAFVDKLLVDDVNGDNAASCFGRNFWDIEDGWILSDDSESFSNPWLNLDMDSPEYGHPLHFEQLQKKLGKKNAIIAEWITKTLRLCHDLGEQFKFNLSDVIKEYIPTSKREWDIENTFENKDYIEFIKNSPYKRIVSCVIKITMSSNHRNGVRKGQDFNRLWRIHQTEWNRLIQRQISNEQYNKLMIQNIEKCIFL